MAEKVIICDKNIGASGGGCGLKTVALSLYCTLDLMTQTFCIVQANVVYIP